MKTIGWIVAGAGACLAAYVVLNSPSLRCTAGSGEVANAADKASLWGAKQRVQGTVGSLAGKVKEGLGNAAGSNDLAAEGAVDQVAGAVKNTAGKAASAVSDTLREFNR